MDQVTPQQRLRFVTAASLFDGHDAAINIMRRILQALGAEVIHLGHNRSVEQIVTAACQEDAHGIAISSYQGGHLEFFKYTIDLLAQRGRSDIKVFGGGGGVIIPEEIQALHDYGVERIYSPTDGQTMGLKGMLEDVIRRSSAHLSYPLPQEACQGYAFNLLARQITAIENRHIPAADLETLTKAAGQIKTPVIGITGTGGAGKSSITDELIRYFTQDNPNISIALLGIDPSKKRTGGALLGDRIRMNAVYKKNLYMRSIATRNAQSEICEHLQEMIHACKAFGFDLIIVETSGIGQGDSTIVSHVDLPIYVMTPEFGAPSQLEKIDMLDFAKIVVINKFDRTGAKDALRDVRKQFQRNHEYFDQTPESLPIYGTMASRFNDQGMLALYHGVLGYLNQNTDREWDSHTPSSELKYSTDSEAIIPAHRQRYLSEIVDVVKAYLQKTEEQAHIASQRQALQVAQSILTRGEQSDDAISKAISDLTAQLDSDNQQLINEWPQIVEQYQQPTWPLTTSQTGASTPLFTQTLSGLSMPKVALPRYRDQGDLLKWRRKENCPGQFPFTAGVFPLKRAGEDPTRMFAGEGDAYKTNERFKLLSRNSLAKRLSTAFDSVTLYGCDPDLRPDIYGKVGNSGVSIATLDDMRVLYDGFNLCDPATSVSMTINGPAPTILAMFLNVAIEQQMQFYQEQQGRVPTQEEATGIKASALASVRGTVQADILKEDQGQNTCIFSTEFSLKMMGDVQAYFIQQGVKNFYSVSISGYHIAEAGANPITQLAFTLANGFTYVEAYLARGMDVNDFAPSFSFFFSNGMDPEYSVMGRVARRIWAIAMKEKYGANTRSQKLKYHVQTSGRSLHAQEMQFNDIRTTLEALIAVYDNCNSLHTNAYDEAITTPTEDSVRRALAIQLIINQEWGMSKNHNPNQGSFILEELTDLVEAAVLEELERISERGGVLGAMETGYQRSKIQDESMLYEMQKHQGDLPIIGVNTFVKVDDGQAQEVTQIPLQRSTEEEKQRQLTRLAAFHSKNEACSEQWLKKIQLAAEQNENVFAVLMDAVRYCSLGQITDALFRVGGEYRRNM